MMPLPYRRLTALMMRYNGSSLLIDCGEGSAAGAFTILMWYASLIFTGTISADFRDFYYPWEMLTGLSP